MKRARVEGNSLFSSFQDQKGAAEDSLKMPQTTLSRTLKISPTRPPTTMKTPIKNAAKLTPAILKAKQSGAQGRFPGTLRSMEDDIRALGLDPVKFLGKGLGRGGATGFGNRNTGAGEAPRGVKGETGVPDVERTEIDHKKENKAFEAAAEVIALDGDSDDGLNERMRGGRRGKGKLSTIAPTEEDVHPESKDHVKAANAVQKESDKAVRNAASDHAAVVGTKGLKRRAPSPGEGGVAGAEGHDSPAKKNNDRVPKKRKDAYEIRKYHQFPRPRNVLTRPHLLGKTAKSPTQPTQRA